MVASWVTGSAAPVLLRLLRSLLPAPQFCLTLSVVACLEAAAEGGAALYIDTESKFSSKRWVGGRRPDSGSHSIAGYIHGIVQLALAAGGLAQSSSTKSCLVKLARLGSETLFTAQPTSGRPRSWLQMPDPAACLCCQ